MSIQSINGELLLEIFKHSTAVLNKNKDMVDALNVFPVPDGDTGTNMSLTMNSALNEAMKVQEKTVENISKAVSKGALLGARGNSGVILSQIFRGFAKGCEGVDELGRVELIEAIYSARESAYKAVLKPVEGTILTVIRKTSDYGKKILKEEMSLSETMDALMDKANKTLESTPEYLEVLKQAGVVDAGGRGLVCILEGFKHVIDGNEAHEHDVEVKSNETMHKPAQSVMNTEDIKFMYCTEFIVKTKKGNTKSIKADIQSLGDSMVYVEDDDIVKVHIHTNNPDKALCMGLSIGEFISVKIENMKQQHSSIVDKDCEHCETDENCEMDEKKEVGFIAVCTGDGVADIFKNFGADYIITGGQTMNPSTEDIIKGIESVNSDTIFIFPNNSNIILAANQAKEISDKNIIVIPSKTIPQGITSIISYNFELDVEANEKNMIEALSEVKTIQVTYSVRDTVFNEMEIKENDILGIADGTIVQVGQNIHDVSLQSMKATIDEDTSLVTIYYGQDTSSEDAEKLAEQLEELYDDIDVEVYEGGQPVYYYILSVE